MEWFLRFNSVYDAARQFVDVALLAFLLYKSYELLVKTQASQLIKGFGFLALIYGFSIIFRLPTLEWLLRAISPALFVTIVIVFQPELRKIITRLGQGSFFRPDSRPKLGHLDAVVTAAEILSREKRGMLVVFARRVNIKHIIETGTRLNADISSSLIVTVFEYDTPLHDGAIVIQNNRIAAASCLLPLSEQSNIKKNFGTRHRAALGMSEQSDVVILVVSEESGAISIVYDGQIFYDLSTQEVTGKLKELIDRGSRRGDLLLDEDSLPLESEKE